MLVTFTSASDLEQYVKKNKLPFTVLRDPDRRGYRAFGLGRGSVGRVWGWRAGLRYLQLIGRGGARNLERPTEDTLQLGGDFVISPDGTLVYGFWGEGPDDRPSVDQLFDAVRKLT